MTNMCLKLTRKYLKKKKKKNNSILEKQNMKLKRLQQKDRYPPVDTQQTTSEKPKPKPKKKQEKQNKKAKPKHINKPTHQENVMKHKEANKAGNNQTDVQTSNNRTNNQPNSSSEQSPSNQPKNSPTPGTKKTYAEATKTGVKMNVHETLVSLLSTVKTLLENNRGIIPGGETGDSTAKPTKTNGRKKRKGNKKIGGGETSSKELVRQKIF